MSTSSASRHFRKLERNVAFARRGQKRKALKALQSARHEALREFVAAPQTNEPPAQKDMFLP